jgi:caffeoyl-CoA O-methyltransferase
MDTPGEFDFVFNDIDKAGYLAVLETVPNKLKTGGLFVTDNTLWHEKVLDPRDPTSKAVVEFDRRLFQSKQFSTSLIPIRDGLTVSLRLFDSAK